MGEFCEEEQARMLERIEQLEELCVASTEMLVGLVREQYAHNVLAIKQGVNSEFLAKTNEDLLDRMADLLARRTIIKDGHPKDSLVYWLEPMKAELKIFVEEYLKKVTHELG
jgi:hypothetical protein